MLSPNSLTAPSLVAFMTRFVGHTAHWIKLVKKRTGCPQVVEMYFEFFCGDLRGLLKVKRDRIIIWGEQRNGVLASYGCYTQTMRF